MEPSGYSERPKTPDEVVFDFSRRFNDRLDDVVTHHSVDRDPRFSDFAREHRLALAAFLALPANDNDRNQLMDEFRRNADKRFNDDQLVALSEYRRHGPRIRAACGQDWRNCFSHADGLSHVSDEDMVMLDVIGDLMSVPAIEEPHARLVGFVAAAEQRGLLTAEEAHHLQADLAKAEAAANAKAQALRDARDQESDTAMITNARVQAALAEKGDFEPEELSPADLISVPYDSFTDLTERERFELRRQEKRFVQIPGGHVRKRIRTPKGGSEHGGKVGPDPRRVILDRLELREAREDLRAMRGGDHDDTSMTSQPEPGGRRQYSTGWGEDTQPAERQRRHEPAAPPVRERNPTLLDRLQKLSSIK